MGESNRMVRQQSRFLNLMNDYANSVELYEGALEAAGTAQSKFNLYLESNQATLDNFRTTLEGLWITIIDSDSLMDIVRAGTSFIELLDSMVDSFGLLGSAATILIPLIGVRYVVSVTSATKAMIAQELAGQAIGNSNISLMNGFKLLIGQLFGVKTAADGTAISFMGLNAAAGILGVALVAIPVLITAIATAEDKRKKAMEESLALFEKQNEANKSIGELVKSYEELGDKAELTAEESKKLLDVKTQIKDLLPQSKNAIDNENLSLKEQVEIIKDLNEQELQRVRMAASETIDKYGKDVDFYKKSIDERAKSIENMTDKLSKLQLKQARGQELTSEESKELKNLIHWIELYNGHQENAINIVEAVESAHKILEGTVDDLSSSTEDLESGIEGIGDTFETSEKALVRITKTFEDVTSKIQAYNVLLDELNSKEGLSAKSKQDIITKYQEFLPYISDEQELRRQLILIIAQEEETQRKAYVNMIMLSEDFFSAKVKGNEILVKTLGEFYTKDLENAKSLADAKRITEESLIKDLSGKWAKYYNIASSNQLAEADYRKKLAFGYGTAEEKAAMRAAINAIDQQKEVARRFDELAKGFASGVDFSGINLSSNKGSKSSSTKEDYKALADRYARINLELDKNNILLQKNKTLQDLASDDLAKKIPLMEEEISLNKQRQASLHELNNERRKEMIELEKTLSGQGFNFEGEGDNRIIANLDNIKGKTKEVEEQFKRYIELQSSLLPQASQEWWNLKNTIENIVIEQEKLIAQQKELVRTEWIKKQNDLYDQQQERLKSLESIQEAIVAIIRKRGEEEKKALDEAYNKDMEQLDERHNKRKEKYAEDLDDFKKLIQGKLDALDEQYETEDYLEQLNKEREEANRLQSEIDVLSLDDSLTARNKTIELRKQLADQNEKIAKLQQKKERDLLKKSLQDQLKSHEQDAKDKETIEDKAYDNRKKALEEDYENNKKFLDKKYSDEKVYAEARESIMRGTVETSKGMFEDIYDAFEDFEDKFGKGMGILGDIIKKDFLDQLKLAKKAIEELDYKTSNQRPKYDNDYQPTEKEMGSSSSGSSSNKGIYMSASDFNKYINYKLIYDMAKDAGNKASMDAAKSSAQAIRDKYGITSDKYSYDDLKNRSYKDVTFKHGGKLTQTGTMLAEVHGTKTNPEWIFNDSQLKSIVRDVTMSAIRVVTPKIPNVAPQQGITLQIDNFIKADNITKESIPELKKVQVNAMQDLKNLLIKNGVRPSLI